MRVSVSDQPSAMIRAVLPVLCFVSFGAAMSVKAQASKKMSYVSPDGADSMWFERSSVADLDSSASGYVYHSDGLGPATLLHLNSYQLPVPQTFQQINHGFDTVGQPVQEYVKGGGAVGNSGFYANNADKGEKGYNGFDAYQKGLLSKFDKNQDTGYYNGGTGHKKGHHDVGGHYAGFNAANKGEQGGSFGEESSQKKGHKTTGFHKVYHKDEFKKEHSFYDESDKSGHKDQYGKGESAFGAEKGGFQKGGHLDSGYHAGEQGSKGYYDKGESEEEDSGYQGAKGTNGHFSDSSEFGNTGGEDFHKGYGFGLTGYGYGY